MKETTAKDEREFKKANEMCTFENKRQHCPISTLPHGEHTFVDQEADECTESFLFDCFTEEVRVGFRCGTCEWRVSHMDAIH